MPDQYGRVTGRDWLGLAGAISNIDSMRRGQEYLGMQQAKEGRAEILFEQSQRDIAFNNSVKKYENEYVGNLTTGGFIDERGIPTNLWNSTMSKNLTESTRENTAIKKQGVERELEAQGSNALAFFIAQTNINSQLASNAQSNKALTQTAFDKGREDFGNIKTTMTTASDFYRQGDTAKALKMAKETLDNSVVRRTGEIVDDKIYIIKTVEGVKHRGSGFTYPEVEEFINNYTMEEHATGFAADAQVGREMALKPPMMMRTPDGKTVLVKQTGTSFGVDYFFFNPDGTVLKNPPKDLEQAYSKGWMKEEDVFSRERGIAKEERATAKEKRATAKEEIAKEPGLSFTEKERYKTASKELTGLQESLADPLTMNRQGLQTKATNLMGIMKRLETREAGGKIESKQGDTNSRQATLRQIAGELKTKFPNASREQLKELLKLMSGEYGDGEEARRIWEQIMNELSGSQESGLQPRSVDAGSGRANTDYLDRYQGPQRPRWGSLGYEK